MTSILILGGILAVGILIFGVITSLRPQPSVVQERLGRYADIGAQVDEEPAAAPPKERGSPIGERLNEAIQRFDFSKRIQRDLARADLKLNAGEYISLIAIACVGTATLAVGATVIPDCISSDAGFIPCLFTRSNTDSTFLGIIGAIVGLFVPRFYIRFLQKRRLKNFNNQLGDSLMLMVNGLRSGYSVLQAMEAIARELPDPIAVEFRRVVQEIQLGLPMESALEHLLERMNSDDLDLVITAINIQREVGGNLAEILDVISHTIRERVRIKGEIATLTAQGRATGYAITGLPLGLGLLLFVVNRPYIGQLFIPESQPCGWGMVILGLVMIAIGGFIIGKIVDIEI